MWAGHMCVLCFHPRCGDMCVLCFHPWCGDMCVCCVFILGVGTSHVATTKMEHEQIPASIRDQLAIAYYVKFKTCLVTNQAEEQRCLAQPFRSRQQLAGNWTLESVSTLMVLVAPGRLRKSALKRCDLQRLRRNVAWRWESLRTPERKTLV